MRCCEPGVSVAVAIGASRGPGSLSLGRYPAYAKHSEAGPEWYGIFRRLTVESRPSQCPSTASASFTTA